MTRRTHYLHGVTVRGSVVNRVNRSAFDAVAIDTRRLRNTNLDIAHVLDRVSGVKLRQDGGVGSQASINLNGFTGKHVRLLY
jgi:outer membrane cobalamin receptor